MSDTLFLKTEGYQVSFEMKSMPQVPDEFDTTITFRLDPRLGNVMLTSSPMLLALNDLQRLASYLEQHIALIQDNPFSESETFVPQDLQFQLQAGAGDVDSPEDGEFALRFLINVGKTEEDSSSVYAGGEATITLENVNLFLSAVAGLLARRTK